MVAILTRYLGPTNYRGSRYKATAGDEPGRPSLTVSCDSALGSEANHASAAYAFALKMGWRGRWVGGGTYRGMAFVWVGDDYAPTSFEPDAFPAYFTIGPEHRN